MRISVFVIFLGFTIPIFSQSEWVNPFIGTGGTGHTFPAACYPFGMVQVGPDTRVDGSWEGCSGYHYDDKTIYGFSHTHLSGTGCSDYGDVMLMPYMGTVPQQLEKAFYKSTFSHTNEKAEPGFYSVKLDNGILCEMSAAEHSALHKYTFADVKNGQAHIVLDLTHRDKLLGSEVKRKGPNALIGFRSSEAWARNQTAYFYLESDKNITNISYLKSEDKIACVIITFDLKNENSVSLKVGISGVDVNGAENNALAELPDFNITNLRTATKAAWDKELSKINITTNSTTDKTNFYTAFYHTMIHPNVFSDVDGRYRGHDDKIHQTTGKYYTVFSLWDTFRALHPLHMLINRKRSEDFVSTFLWQYQQGGRLPMWELWCNETDCMIGYHAVPVLADALAKGIPMDKKLALEAAVSNANFQKYSIPTYATKGYLEIGDENESVAKTLEYAYDDWCVAQLARANGDTATENLFLKRSMAWMNMLDNQTGLMRPRINGGWLTPFDPREVNNHYTEANAWQYSFFVLHDIPTLLKALGEKRFETLLDSMFNAPSQTTGREQADITGLIGQYAHGNEPSHHMIYLYNYLGRHHKTAKLAQHILKDLYKPAPDGLPGNEDCGQMSAWYIFSSLGFYPVTPGSNSYMIGFPIFEQSSIKLENGEVFSVKARGNSQGNHYIEKLELNGKKLDRFWLTHDEIMGGGELFIQFSDKPPFENIAVTNNPFPVAKINDFVAAPEIRSSQTVFKKETDVLIQYNFLEDRYNCYSQVWYTLDGTDPRTGNRLLYQQPIKINRETVIRAVSITCDNKVSKEATAHFIPFPHPERKIKINSTYNKQYSAGGDEGLIDGVRGAVNWRKGNWQGYQNTDFSAEVDLGKKTDVHFVEVGFLQDFRAWIALPRSVTVEYLNENRTVVQKTEMQIPVQDKEENTFIYPFKVKENITNVRYVRITAVNYGALPSWHPGAGSPAFIFTDEIIVE